LPPERQRFAANVAARMRSTLGNRAENFSGCARRAFRRLLAWQLHRASGTNKSEIAEMKLQPFAQHEQALNFRALRNEVLSSNIANADTPNYKARDVDFHAALKNAQNGGLALRKTSALHNSAANVRPDGADLKFRVPTQPSIDGNTVQTDIEQTAFAENALQYRASLTFLNGTIQTLRYALKGGD
jgi:flagellar basal-body rod protein FlgB